ncbi:MAG: TetR/AcrR family transcriptional regulator [Candidatus Dormibacteraeota bacterium]|uniref:TetR/AcrR family transcriptional regulator n=1 Tax=Candidatus Amunia macphersoniae TaxID=3127014 RepID=A0A934NE66_9BACT|nr:TetR/AcrR family transcriptional regulator [Candidatus Dormibacteraeota bacterium]
MTPVPTATRRRGTGFESRRTIVDAAVVEFARSGYRGASTDAIAVRAGISQPYVFRLFGSKLALFLEVYAQAFGRLLETFRTAANAAIAVGADPLEAMGMSYLPLLEDRALLNLQMQSYIAATDEPEIRDACRRSFRELMAFLEALPGSTSIGVSRFLSAGMFLNVAAAIDLLGLAETSDWARRCIDGVLTDCTSTARPGRLGDQQL